MNHSLRIPVVWVLLVVVLTLVGTEGPRPVLADNHLIDINEFFSNADGTLQFVELIALANFQTNLGPTHIGCANSDSSVAQVVFDFVTTYPELDTGETILVATAAFQGAAGFAPDFVMPDGRIFLTSGRLKFDHDAPNNFLDIDAVAYGNYTGPNTGFGPPAVALPSDGFHSLTRTGPDNNNAKNFDSLPNSPRRNDGMEGQILPTAVESPALSPAVLDLAVAPNPIAGGTRLQFDLVRGGQVRIAVYGAEGRQVRELWQGPMEAGPRVVHWDRRDAAGRLVPAGVYYLRLSAGAATNVAKATVLP